MIRNRLTRQIGLATAAAGVVAATLLAIPLTANAEPDLPAGTYAVSFDSERQAEQLVSALGLAPKQRFAAAFDGVTVKLTARQANALASDPRVAGITIEQVFEGQAQTVPPSVGTVEADDPPVRAGDGSGAWAGPGVAIVDSGVSQHSDINLALAVNCFGSGTAADANGHGTGVAGFMAAYDNAHRNRRHRPRCTGLLGARARRQEPGHAQHHPVRARLGGGERGELRHPRAQPEPRHGRCR